MAAKSRPRWGAVFLATAVFGLVPLTAPASEPAGAVALLWEWLAEDDRTILSVTAEPVRGLSAARLHVTIPAGLDVEPVGPAGESAPRYRVEHGPLGERRLTLEFEDWPARRLRAFRFAVNRPVQGGAIVTIEVSGSGPDGRPLREATGISVGHPGAPGRLRDGVIEYSGDGG